MEHKTPLFDKYADYGAKIIDFGGFLMPVQFAAGIKKEHMAVRQAAGLFDICHMGEIVCSGPKALDAINMLLTNDYTNLKVGSARYGNMCNEQGGILDDVIVFRLEEEKYLLVVNAGTQESDYKWMKEHTFGADFENVSDKLGALAFQGPKAPEVLRKLTSEENIPQKYYTFKYHSEIHGIPCMISRTGYTGELGYEIYPPADRVGELWDLILKEGKEDGVLPIGLGARDTLRLEASMPLYGNDMDESINPLEAGLTYGIKMNKADFIGKKAIEAKGDPKIRRVGLKVTGRGIVREHQDLYIGDEKVGHTTSGTYCPYLKGAYAMGYVGTDHAEAGTELEADVRGRRVKVEIVPMPFYKRK